MINESSTLVDVAFAVSTALSEVGVTAVLTGGSAATFYAPEAYQSRDVDFVITMWGDGQAESALRKLGLEKGQGNYRHPRSIFPVEFPKGPLMIGDDHIDSWATQRQGDELLHVLSATDSCRDRLAAFLFWNDFSGLEQALAVATAHQEIVALDDVRSWCEREGFTEKFELFAARLSATL